VGIYYGVLSLCPSQLNFVCHRFARFRYQNDTFMTEALHLLESTYTQRMRLVGSLQDSVLLEHPHVAVYGDVHALRADITELSQLISTYAVWGVKSNLSGDFDDKKFGKVMNILDSLLEFIYTPQWEDDGDAAAPAVPPPPAIPSRRPSAKPVQPVEAAVVARSMEWAVAAPLEIEESNHVGDDFEKKKAGMAAGKRTVPLAAPPKSGLRSLSGNDEKFSENGDGDGGAEDKPAPQRKGLGGLGASIGAGSLKSIADPKRLSSAQNVGLAAGTGLNNLRERGSAGLGGVAGGIGGFNPKFSDVKSKLTASTTNYFDAAPPAPKTTAGQRLVAVILEHLAMELPALDAPDRVDAFFNR